MSGYKRTCAKEAAINMDVRCILCDREFGNQPGPAQAKNKCSLKRTFDSKIDGAVTLSQLINEVLGLDLDQRFDEEDEGHKAKGKNMYACLHCAQTMLNVKIKRKHLLTAEEQLLNIKSETGYINTFTKRMSRKRPMSRQIAGTSKVGTSTPAKEKVQVDSPNLTSIESATSSSSSTSSSSPSLSTSKRPRQGFAFKTKKEYKLQIYNAIIRSEYGRAFKLAFKKSATATHQIPQAIKEMAQVQMSMFTRKGMSLKQKLNRDTAGSFNWGTIFAELKQSLPILCAVLEGSLTSKADSHRVQIEDNKLGDLIPGMGVVLSMVSKMRGPKRFNFVPTLLGMALYKNGCSSSLMDALNKIGFCMVAQSVRRIVDRYGERYNDEILAVTGAIEAAIQNDETKVYGLTPEGTLDHSMTAETEENVDVLGSNVSDTDDKDSVVGDSDEIDTSVEEMADEPGCEFSMSDSC
ncbi:uncharacterized protein LOC117298609 isoform X2 [Asterias rubens]|uniref:uncharacterized protein LOC117298609 isoform X2 n=1 Tax=Asterias rubens TaxID=7604 RepID=UPI0014551A76|nr:uncharacterized protein LOC117298609 isoform X2 [Asterias rubens]